MGVIFWPRPAAIRRVRRTSGLALAWVGFGFLLTLAGLTAGLFLGIAFGVGCFFLPDYYLKIKTRGRKESIQVQMPDILDLLCVSVEAGLGFDAALGKVAEKMEGPLVDEVSIMLQEMRIGESRPQALRNFSERVDLPETTSFARSIIQADQLGISLGRILRVQAQDMRNRRQLAAVGRCAARRASRSIVGAMIRVETFLPSSTSRSEKPP